VAAYDARNEGQLLASAPKVKKGDELPFQLVHEVNVTVPLRRKEA
jgi:hypothetical protein